jgi:hypothetical protein
VLRLFDRLFAEHEFLSPYGMRGVAAHRGAPYDLDRRSGPPSTTNRPSRRPTCSGELELAAHLVPLNYLLPARSACTAASSATR